MVLGGDLPFLAAEGRLAVGTGQAMAPALVDRWGEGSSIDGAEMFGRFRLPATIP